MSREHHSDIQRPDGKVSEARYGPGGAASARRREQLAAKAAARGVPRPAVARKPKAPAQPIFTQQRRKFITLILAVATVVALAGVFLFSPLTRVRHVKLSGAAALLPNEATQTAAAVTIAPGTNLFTLRAGPIVGKLSRLPWVASASIHRRFPNRLEVSVKPRVPRARLQAGGQDWEIDQAGVLIRPLRSGVDLPLIACSSTKELRPGSRADADGLAGALRVIQDCAPRGGVKIVKVDVDANGELCLNMSDTVAIRLGREEALSTKIDYVQRIYDDKPGIGSEVQSIDLRWPESPSCVLRNAGKTKPGEASQHATERSASLQTGGPSHAPRRD